MSRAWCVWIAVIAGQGALGGCASGDDPPALGTLPPVVTRLDPVSAADCPTGGAVVLAGTDANRNGVLDDAEVRTRDVVCNPAVDSMPATVVRLVTEPRGLACPEGGTAVQSGPDRNGNHTLDPDEVAVVSYVCGQALATRIVPELEGTNCPDGGLAFQAGLDRDGNHQLDDDEVAETEYECGTVLARNVLVTSQDELAALAHVTAIQGRLEIFNPADTADEAFRLVALPDLQVVHGEVAIRDLKFLVRIDLPQLQVVGRGFQVADNALLADLTAPRLDSVGGTFDVSRNPELLTIAVPTSVHEDFLVRDDVSLTALPVAEVTGRIEITGNLGLGELFVEAGEQTRHVLIAGNRMPTLVVDADLSNPRHALPEVEIRDNAGLTSVDVFATHAAALRITGNADLDTVSIAGGTVDGDLEIEGARLDTVFLLGQRLDDRAQIGGALRITGPLSSLSVFSGIDVGGDLVLDGTQLGLLADIDRVGGALRLRHNLAMTGAASIFPLGGGLELVDNPALTSALFCQQAVIGGDVRVEGNPALRSVQSLLLAGAVHGSVTIRDNPAMVATLAGPRTIDGGLEISGNAALTGLGFEALERVGGAITIRNNAALPTIALGALAGTADVAIEDNAAVAHLTLPRLVLANAVGVRRNPHLPSCEVAAVFAHVQADSLDQSDNDDAASCAP